MLIITLFFYPNKLLNNFLNFFLFQFQADLEQAVALSLGLEEEKLRLQEIEAKKSSSSIIKKGVVIESRNVGEKDVDVKVINRTKQYKTFFYHHLCD